MNRVISVLFLACVCLSAVDAYDYRNISIFQNDALNLFVATAVKAEITAAGKQVTYNADVLQLAVLSNQINYLHYSGDGVKNIGQAGDSYNGAAFGMYIQFLEVIEYKETNNVDGYQVGADVKLSSYPLLIVDWKVSTTVTNHTYDDGTVGQIYKVTFSTPNNVFNFTVTYSGRDVTIDGVAIDANTCKVGININYYNYGLASSDAASQIALNAIVVGVSGSAKKQAKSAGQASITVNKGSYAGFIDFEDSADTWKVGGVTAKASAHLEYTSQTSQGNVVQGWSASAITLSYLETRPLTISHDPEIGMNAHSGSSVAKMSVAMFILALLSVIVL